MLGKNKQAKMALHVVRVYSPSFKAIRSPVLGESTLMGYTKLPENAQASTSRASCSEPSLFIEDALV